MAYITQAAWGRKHNFTRQYVNKLVNNGTIKLHNGKVNEEAADMAKATARCEGLAVGVSAGAALAAAVKIGQRQEMKGKNIVVILPDAAERYLSTGLLD